MFILELGNCLWNNMHRSFRVLPTHSFRVSWHARYSICSSERNLTPYLILLVKFFYLKFADGPLSLSFFIYYILDRHKFHTELAESPNSLPIDVYVQFASSDLELGKHLYLSSSSLSICYGVYS